MNEILKKMDLQSSIKLCIDKYFENKIYMTPELFFMKKMMEFMGNPKSYKYQLPLFLSWEITAECNLRCKHCYYYKNDSKFNAIQDLSTQRILEIIDEIADMNIVHIDLTGGEPLLRNDIFEIIEKIKSKNISLKLSSNGILITKDIARKLSKLLNPYMDSVQISLEGAYAHTHEQLRGNGTFEKTIQGIKNLVEEGVATFVNSTVTTENINELTDLYKLTHKLGVKKLSLAKIIPTEESHYSLISDMDILFKEFANIIKLEKKNKVPFFEIATFKLWDFLNHEQAKEVLQKIFKNKKIPMVDDFDCHNNSKININKDGKVYLCFRAADLGLFPMGDLKNESLSDIWNRKTENELFKARNSVDMSCKKCQYASFCKAGCPLNAFLKFNTILAPDSNCIEGEKLFLCVGNKS